MEEKIKELIRFKIWLENNPRLVNENHKKHVKRFLRINGQEAHSERSEANEKVCEHPKEMVVTRRITGRKCLACGESL